MIGVSDDGRDLNEVAPQPKRTAVRNREFTPAGRDICVFLVHVADHGTGRVLLGLTVLPTPFFRGHPVNATEKEECPECILPDTRPDHALRKSAAFTAFVVLARRTSCDGSIGGYSVLRWLVAAANAILPARVAVPESRCPTNPTCLKTALCACPSALIAGIRIQCLDSV
jgi:hypothetical protein